MAADVRTSLKDWSTTVGSNLPTGSTSISTNLDDNLCQIQATVRYETASRDTIASATTCDLGTKDAGSLDITGTTTITSFGTVSAGIRKLVTFSGALTLTHNATSLKLPGSANITTVAGDTGLFESLGSGNWNCLFYQRKSSVFPGALTSGYYLTNNGTSLSWGLPSVALSSLSAAGADNTLANGIYKQTWGWSGAWGAGGVGLQLEGTSSNANGTLLKLTGTIPTLLDIRPSSGHSGALTLSSSGAFSVSGGTSAVAGNGASASITAQSAGAGSNGNGGGLNLTAGAADGTGTCGTIAIAAQAGGLVGGSITMTASSGSSTSGDILLSGAVGGVKLRVAGGAPTISSGGGAGASIRGCDNFFEVTCGTGSPSNVVIGFSVAKASAPMCIVSSSADAEMKYATTVNGVTITPASGTLTSGTKITCMVIEAT